MRRTLLTGLLMMALQSTTAFAGGARPGDLVKNNDNDFARFLVNEFKKYPADVVHTFVKPQLVLKKRTSSYKYRNEIRRQFEKNDINFAGHWILVTIGCGKNCLRFFLIDGVSGEITDPNLTANNGSPFFEAESRLLYVGPGVFKSYDDAMKSPGGGKPKAWLEEAGQLMEHELKFK